jgi:hypothetical protein
MKEPTEREVRIFFAGATIGAVVSILAYQLAKVLVGFI